MVEHVAAQVQWFLPQLIQLLQSPAAALFPVVPIASYMDSRLEFDCEDPPWARFWTKAEAQADTGVGHDVIPTIAITEDDFRASDWLVSDRYAWRGYGTASRGTDCAQREVTLLAWSKRDTIVGTMTMGVDGGDGLLANQTYASHLDAIRAQGRTVCEFTRFAVAAAADSKATISELFDLSYVLGRNMLGVTDVVVEVNPRHVGFYRRAFGFRAISDVRICERVNAPAVLLRLDVAELESRMREVGAKMPGELALAKG